MAIIVRSIVLAFRYRSRRPVLAYARTEHNCNADNIIKTVSSLNDLTEPTGEGRFLPIVLLANSIHPTYTTPPTSASLRSASGRRGYGGANWLAYNMGMARWIDPKPIFHHDYFSQQLQPIKYLMLLSIKLNQNVLHTI